MTRKHDLRIEYPSPEWIDGLPLANGRMGAMVWGNGHPLRFTLDHYAVWETRYPWPGDDPCFNYRNLRRLKESGRIKELNAIALRRRNQRFTGQPPIFPTRLCLGRLELDWPAEPASFRGRLDFPHAEATIDLDFDHGRVRLRSLVASMEDALVIDIRAEGVVALPTVRLTPAAEDETSRKHFRAWGYPQPELRAEQGRWILRRSYGKANAYVILAREVRTIRRLRVFVTIVAGADDESLLGRAIHRLEEVQRQGIPALRQAHRSDWRNFWKQSDISIPDKRLEKFYAAEMYKLHCSSRPGSLPISLQGLWTTDGAWPPWRGNYTTDQNVQLSYLPIYASNHLENGQPLYEMYWRNLPLHRKLGRYWYGKPMAIVSGEHGPGGEPFPGYFTDEHSPGAGAWIAHLFWLHWCYSQDKHFLRDRAYPFMREMVQAYLHIVEKRADGKYHIPFTDSPEFFGGRPDSLGDDTNYDLALLRFLLSALLDAQQVLLKKDPQRGQWKKVLDQLAEYPTAPARFFEYNALPLGPDEPRPNPADHQALTLRAGQPLTQSHRHHSHLIGIHPLGVIDPERSTMERRWVDNSLEDLVFNGTGEWCGWSFAWAALLAARAGRGMMAQDYLQRYFDGFTGPNTLHRNGDWQGRGLSAYTYSVMTLEAGLAAAAGILEMLLQSQNGIIRLFPACPPEWGDVAFRDLRAEGAFLVCARRQGGRVVRVGIRSEAGGICRIRNPFGSTAALTTQSNGRSRRLQGEQFSFRTKRGATYHLTPLGSGGGRSGRGR